jgi:SAM-dependent methyltransferase
MTAERSPTKFGRAILLDINRGRNAMSELDEMGLTPEAAQGYEQYFVPAIFDQWPPRIIESAGVGSDDNVLEVGCGTGVLAREVVKRVGPNGAVTGLDLSESMLGVARELCPDVDFRQGNAMSLPFDDKSFDVAIASFVLMFVPDPVLAVSELWRVLKPGGRVVITVWEALGGNPVYAGLVDIAKRRIDDAAGSSLAWPFALGENGKLEEICGSAGVADVAISAHDGRAKFPSLDGFVKTEIQSWVLADSVDEENLNAVAADAQERFADYCDNSGAVNIPLNAIMATAKKN